MKQIDNLGRALQGPSITATQVTCYCPESSKAVSGVASRGGRSGSLPPPLERWKGQNRDEHGKGRD